MSWSLVRRSDDFVQIFFSEVLSVPWWAFDGFQQCEYDEQYEHKIHILFDSIDSLGVAFVTDVLIGHSSKPSTFRDS